jgi:hypothetical protein
MFFLTVHATSQGEGGQAKAKLGVEDIPWWQDIQWSLSAMGKTLIVKLLGKSIGYTYMNTRLKGI